MAQQASIAIGLMLLLFDAKIESNLRAGSTIAIMHGCNESHAALSASQTN